MYQKSLSPASRGRRACAAALAAGVLVLGLAACGSSDSSSQTKDGVTTLTWWDYFGYSPQSDSAVKTLIDKYQAGHPKVKIQRTSVGFADFHTKLVQAAATGHFPDIAAIDNADVPVFASQGALADMSKYLEAWPQKDQYLPAVLQSTKYDGKDYGIPFRSNTTALWYNQDAFTEAGITVPPATWDELRADAKKLTTPKHSGICFAAAATDEGTFTFLPMLWQAGGDVKSIGDAASVAALNYVKNLVVVDKSAPQSVLQWGQSDVGDQFGSGQCAMMFNGPWVLGSAKKGGFTFATAPWPAGPAGTASPLGGEVWAVSKQVKDLSTVWDVLSWMGDPKNSATEIGTGLSSIPNRKDTVSDKAWQWDPTVSTFASQMSSAHARGVYGPNYAQISQAISGMEQQVLAQGKDPQAAASAAATTIKPLLSK
jgi:multiple sugar transport system substrate-binding protein